MGGYGPGRWLTEQTGRIVDKNTYRGFTLIGADKNKGPQPRAAVPHMPGQFAYSGFRLDALSRAERGCFMVQLTLAQHH